MLIRFCFEVAPIFPHFRRRYENIGAVPAYPRKPDVGCRYVLGNIQTVVFADFSALYAATPALIWHHKDWAIVRDAPNANPLLAIVCHCIQFLSSL